MIEYVELKNFQKHESKRFDFTEGVNYITGVNGAGKSTCLRAIAWVALNAGDSKSFRRTYMQNGSIKTSSETSVEIGVDGHTVKRVLSNSKNEYWFDGVKCTGFGRGVPEQISKLFNMEELNISEQFAPLFLIGETSGGAISKELNEVASLEEMDILTANVNADVRKANTSLTACIERMESIGSMISKIDSYSALFDLVEGLQSLYNEYADTSDIDTMEQAVKALKRTSYIGELKSITKTFNNYTMSDTDFTFEDVSELEELVEWYNRLNKNKYDKIVPLDVTEDFFDVSDTRELQDMIDRLTSLNVILKEKRNIKAQVENELKEFKTCPLCGGKLEEVCDA